MSSSTFPALKLTEAEVESRFSPGSGSLLFNMN